MAAEAVVAAAAAAAAARSVAAPPGCGCRVATGAPPTGGIGEEPATAQRQLLVPLYASMSKLAFSAVRATDQSAPRLTPVVEASWLGPYTGEVGI